MKDSIIVLLCLIPIFAIGQINYQQPPWHLDCDSLQTQTEMNICSYQKTLLSDSILNNLYSKNLLYYSNMVADLKNDSDSLGYIYFKTILDLYKEAQENFIDYRASLCNLESAKWEGGSRRPLMVNMIFLAITIERIKVVEEEYLHNSNR